MTDRIPQVLCRVWRSANDATFNYCQHCGTPPCRDANPSAAVHYLAVSIDEPLLDARKAAVAATAAQNAGRKRKVAVADHFDAFFRTRSKQLRDSTGADTDDDMDWLCWSDTQGGGTKAVHDSDCPAVGTTTLERCPTGSTCAKRYAASSLEKGFVSKLKCAMSETLG